MGEPKYSWVWDGVNDPEIQLAEFLMEDKRRFKRTAQVVYRTACCNRVVGFVYPVVMVHPDVPVEFKQLDDEGRLMVNDPVLEFKDGRAYPKRAKPFGPGVFLTPLEPGYMYVCSWLFSFRSIDPEFVFEGEGPEDIGFAPAGSMEGLRQGKPAPKEVLENSSPGYIGVAGKRNVWAVKDMNLWGMEERRNNGIILSTSNPPGLMLCKHSEVEFSRSEVLEHMESYKPAKPVMIGEK